jgi:hypothetical protein
MHLPQAECLARHRFTWSSLRAAAGYRGVEAFFLLEGMRWTLFTAAVLYPMVLLTGWIFDVSCEGIVRTPRLYAREAIAGPGFIDFVQLVGLAVVMIIVGYLLSIPKPVEQTVASVFASRIRHCCYWIRK